MNRFLIGLLAIAVSFSAVADQKISALPTASALTGTESIPAVQPGSCAATGGTCKTTPAAITTYVNAHAAISSGQVSGLATSATTDTTNASNITSGTLGAARLPATINANTTGTAGGLSITLPIANGGTGATSFAAAFLPVFSGSITTNDCVKWLSATSIGDAGSPCGGGGGSPGGTSGQIQFNNAGSFGGISTTGSGNVVLATSPTLTTPNLGTPSAITLTNATFPASISGITTLGGLTSANGSTVPATAGTLVGSAGAFTIGHCLQVSSTAPLEIQDNGAACGTGGSTAFSALTGSTNTTAAMVIGTGASLTTTGSGTITATAAPISGVTGLGTGVATFLATPTSANLAGALTDETGTGAAVFASSPTLTTPNLGTPSTLVLTNATGTPSSIGLANGTGLPLSGIASQAANTVACNATGSSAALTACSAATTLGLLNSTTANAQTGTTYTPVIGDANLFVTMNNASANTFCVPPNSSVAYAVGTTLTVEQLGAGTTTVSPAGTSGCAGTGVTITSLQFGSSTTQTYALAGAFDLLQIRQVATNSWLVTGVGPGRAGQGITGTGSVVRATSPTLITPVLGAATATSINGNTLTTGTYTLTGGAGKTLTFNNTLTLAGTDGTTMTFPGTTDTVVTLTATQTLTNKSIAGSEINSGAVAYANGGTGTTGLTSVATATSVTPNCTFGMVKIVASATGTFTVNAPNTCTPFDGQKLTLKVTSPAGGTITYAWNAAYLASATLALPTTSNAASKEDFFAFQWDADKSGWVFLAANQGF